jgi:type I restriction enzyme R subunit/putative DNA methylase
MVTPTRSKREHLRRLVENKDRWSRSLTEHERLLGFLGWHERGYLPHCDFPNLTQLVTIRLHDSMPASRRAEWEHLLKLVDIRDRRLKLEEYLDRGVGECRLREARVAELAETTLLHFHRERYDLQAWCVMPNHVHVLVNVRMTPLGKIMQSWKRFIATQAVDVMTERRSPARLDGDPKFGGPGRRLALQLRWQREYWDTFLRDEEQEQKAIHYIENNPLKAELCRLPEEGPFSSARFRDEYRRLTFPTGRVGDRRSMW